MMKSQPFWNLRTKLLTASLAVTVLTALFFLGWYLLDDPLKGSESYASKPKAQLYDLGLDDAKVETGPVTSAARAAKALDKLIKTEPETSETTAGAAQPAGSDETGTASNGQSGGQTAVSTQTVDSSSTQNP